MGEERVYLLGSPNRFSEEIKKMGQKEEPREPYSLECRKAWEGCGQAPTPSEGRGDAYGNNSQLLESGL